MTRFKDDLQKLIEERDWLAAKTLMLSNLDQYEIAIEACLSHMTNLDEKLEFARHRMVEVANDPQKDDELERFVHNDIISTNPIPPSHTNIVGPMEVRYTEGTYLVYIDCDTGDSYFWNNAKELWEPEWGLDLHKLPDYITGSGGNPPMGKIDKANVTNAPDTEVTVKEIIDLAPGWKVFDGKKFVTLPYSSHDDETEN